MASKYTFKKATIEDLSSFFEVFPKSIQEQFKEYTPKARDFFVKAEYSFEAVKAQLESKDIFLYLAFIKKEVVGYLMTRQIPGGVCFAVWIAVSDNHQKQGVATKLLEVWERDAKKSGVHKLQVLTDKRNIKFYKNRGFLLLGKIPENHYGHDDYFFHKTIQKPLEKNYLR